MYKQSERALVKVALVTGASSGIGAATAERLAAAGYKVYGTSRRGVQVGQRSFEMLSLDVTSDESVEVAVKEVMGREGRIDLLVNNAGFSLATAGAEESSIEHARALFNTNFFGIVRMTRAVLPHMRKQRSGRIINIGSILGFLPAPYMALYGATKHAVGGYSESLDHELRSWGVRVSVVEPAGTSTNIDASAPEADSQLEDHPTVQRIRLKPAPSVPSQQESLDAGWLKQLVLDAGADDVGFVEIGRPALDDQRDDFQPGKSAGLNATFHFTFTGHEKRQATVVIQEQTLSVQAGHVGQPDLHVISDSQTWIGFLREEKNVVWALLRRKIRLVGPLKLLVAFGKCFPQ